MESSGIKTGKVLFVCTANVCRSPMAEAIFNALASEAELPYEARSAGVAALVGEQISPHARTALEEVGVYPGGHRARQADEALMREYDLVLAMTPEHAATLRRLDGSFSTKVYTFLGYASGAPESEGVSDPHGQSMLVHRACVRQLFQHINALVERLSQAERVR